MQNEYVLSFDLPQESETERRKINRDLNKLGAILVHDSFWKSKKLKELIFIAQFIKNSGGKARILEEKLIF